MGADRADRPTYQVAPDSGAPRDRGNRDIGEQPGLRAAIIFRRRPADRFGAVERDEQGQRRRRRRRTILDELEPGPLVLAQVRVGKGRQVNPPVEGMQQQSALSRVAFRKIDDPHPWPHRRSAVGSLGRAAVPVHEWELKRRRI